MTPPPAILPKVVLSAFLLSGLVACGGGRSMVPTPGTSFGAVPNLQGQLVMVYPVQIRQNLAPEANPDAELAFALEERGPRIRWLFPDTLRRITARSPGIALPLEGLQVGRFLQAQVERIGDPLYGQIRRLGALTNAPVALVPIRARYRPLPETVDGTRYDPALELSAALIHVQSGRVLWFGIVDGASGGPDDPRTLASAADAMARAVAR